MTRPAVFVLAQLTLVGLSCGDPTSDPDALDTRGVATLPGLRCIEDLDCFGGAPEQTMGSVVTIEPVAAACVHLTSSALPVCECRGLLTRAAPPPGERPSFEVQLYPGNRPGGCSELTIPGCLYCASEFPGCSVDDPTSCDAVCADVIARAARANQRTYVARARLSRCETNTCYVVTEIDGRCYLGQPGRGDPPEVDCNLSDDELMARVEADFRSPTPSYSCPYVPGPRCTTALDCPHGLGCNENGSCVGCDVNCPPAGAEAGVCEGPYGACASGEACTHGRCVPSANVACRSFTDCAEGESCVFSGTSNEGRGNAQTRSFCTPDRR